MRTMHDRENESVVTGGNAIQLALRRGSRRIFVNAPAS